MRIMEGPTTIRGRKRLQTPSLRCLLPDRRLRPRNSERRRSRCFPFLRDAYLTRLIRPAGPYCRVCITIHREDLRTFSAAFFLRWFPVLILFRRGVVVSPFGRRAL